jgi:hypothetical protein
MPVAPANLNGFLAILPNARNAELLTQLLALLTSVSVVVWAIVLSSTFLRFVFARANRPKPQKSEPLK